MLDLTVVICTYNCATMIEDCLKSVKENEPKSIFLIDGGSSDSTRQIAASYVDEIYDDHALGLAHARNIGIDHVETEYISFVGPDNIMPKNCLREMIDYPNKHDCAIVSAITILRDQTSYWGWAQNVYRLRKYTPGFKSVVGTPTLFRSSLARKFKYDKFMKNSDDTEICYRMAKNGLRFAIADTACYEIGFDNIASVVERWTRYGRGDYLFYMRVHKNWGLARKCRSWATPLLVDFCLPLSQMKLKDAAAIPFLVLIVALRYFGWLRSIVTHVEDKKSAYRKD